MAATLTVFDAEGRKRPPVEVETLAGDALCEVRGDLKGAAIRAKALIQSRLPSKGGDTFAGRLEVRDDAGECVSLNLWQ